MSCLARSLFVTLGLATAATLSAQSLDGEVVRNPDDTVTYTIDLDGPPRGVAVLFASPFLLPAPVPLPIGPLWIDPLALLPVGSAIPIDPLGQAQLQFRLAVPVSLGLPFSFQSLNLDSNHVLMFSHNALALSHNRLSGQNKPFDYQLGYHSIGQDLRLSLQGDPGTSVEARVTNAAGTRASQATNIGPNCQGQLVLPVPGGLQSDDRIEIVKDGALRDTVRLFR